MLLYKGKYKKLWNVWKVLSKNVKRNIYLYFQVLQVPSRNIKKILSLWLESSISWNVRHFFKVGFFSVRKVTSLNIMFSKVSIFWNIRNSFRVSISRNIRKAFFWWKIKKVLIFESESSISWNIKSFFLGRFLFYFFEFGLRFGLGRSIIYY